MTLIFKADMEAEHMKRIKHEDTQLSDREQEIVGKPVRIEIPFASLVQTREYIRIVRAALDQADFLITHQLQNPPTPPMKGKLLDRHVLAAVKSVIRSATYQMPTRQGRARRGE